MGNGKLLFLLFYSCNLFFLNCSMNKISRLQTQRFWFSIIGLYANQTKSPTICNPEEASSPKGWSIARRWNEQTLSAIRVNIPMPTVHARNLFHSSAAMYDAWAAYDDKAKGWLFKNKYFAEPSKINSFREMAMSFAAYRILSHRYKTQVPTTNNPGADLVVGNMTKEFRSQCYNPDYILTGDSTPAAIGNMIAELYIRFGLQDGSNEGNGYADTTNYLPVNSPLMINRGWREQFIDSSIGTFRDPNAWQPLLFDDQLTQNHISLGASTQSYISPNWDSVTPFALVRQTVNSLYIDPGPPPRIDLDNDGIENETGEDLEFATQLAEVVRYSRKLDANSSSLIDISPASLGNNTLGQNDGKGRSINPFTGLPYTPQFVKEADYGRVVAEYWADGPKSETPPGHWFVIGNLISDDNRLEKKWDGLHPISDRLEWDTKLYLALGGALHDAAIVAWGLKRKYTSVRPITNIRRMGALGRLPAISGLIESINPVTRGVGGVLESAGFQSYEDGQQAILAWSGQPRDPIKETAQVKWIRAENWFPYQSRNFVTPAFPGFVSGHSTFSRSAAEVLTRITGSSFFPGGKYSVTYKANTGLIFENGPSTNVTLEWATYYDAGDQAGISRLWGGIHIQADDLEGRKVGSKVGITAFQKVQSLLNGN